MGEAMNDHLVDALRAHTPKESCGGGDECAVHAAADEIERLRGPHYVCSHDGYHPNNRAEWCALGCGSDYNRMHKVKP